MLGALEEQILVAILRLKDGYGMEIRREIDRVTGPELAIGSVYITLDRSEVKGLVVSRRAQENGGSRRLVEVCPAGARALAETHSIRERLWGEVDMRRLSALARA